MLRQTQISLKFYFKDLRYRDAFLLFIIIGPPARWPEGSYELTVCPFVFPSFFPSLRKFSLDWLISFFETQHDVSGPCAVRGRARFFEKNLFARKMGFLKVIGKFSH